MIKVMKRIYTSLAIAAICAAPSMAALENGFAPEQCNIEDKHFVRDLEFVYYTFDGAIELTDIPSVYIVSGTDIVAYADSYSVENYVGKKRTQGTLTAFFEPLRLPLGQDYKVVLSPVTVRSGEDETVINSQYEATFTVPADLGPWNGCISENSVVTQTSSLTVFWGYETFPVGEPEFILLKEGAEIGRYPAYVTWDWDLGQAYAQFGEVLKFERDAHYTLLLPAGSVRTYRDDIVNTEVRLNFIGGYEEPAEPEIRYKYVTFLTHPEGRIGMLGFVYDIPVEVREGGVFYLFNSECSQLVGEVPAWVNHDVNCFMVCADFSDIPIEPEVGYTIVIPDGTVYSSEDPERTNGREVYGVQGQSGIDAIGTDAESDAFAHGKAIFDLYGHRVNNPVKGSVYIIEGRKVVY